MARRRQLKPQCNQQSSTSGPSIAKRRGNDPFNVIAGCGRGRNGKNLELLQPDLLASKAVPRVHDEDSGLGNEATENDCSANCNTNCTIVSQATHNVPATTCTVSCKPNIDPSHTVLASSSPPAAESVTSFHNWLPSPTTILMVTAPSDHKRTTTPPSRGVVTAGNNKALSSSLTNGTTSVRLTRPVGGSHCKSSKRRLNTLSARPGESSSNVSAATPLSGEADAQRPPAKKQATLKKKQALALKRLQQFSQPLIRGSLSLQLTDEVTQELPGECPLPSDSSLGQTGCSRPVPQLLDFRNISSLAFASARSRSSTTGEVTPIIEFSPLERQLNLTEESSIAAKHCSSNGFRRVFVPLLHEEHSNFDEASSDAAEVSLIVSTSPSNQKTHFSSQNCFNSNRDILVASPSALLSSDLTNLCGDLSLSQSSPDLPTSFLSCKPLLVSPKKEGSSLNDHICTSEELISRAKTVEGSRDVVTVLGASQSSPAISLPEVQGSPQKSTSSSAVTKLLLEDQPVNKEKTAPITTDDGNSASVSGSNSKEFALMSAQLSSVDLDAELRSVSSDGRIRLAFVKQPERQHRARYLTEGSRGAVKDQEASGHPVIKVVGTNRPCVVQVFVGSDNGRVGPHVYYQACQVASKTITGISEKKINGTTLIEVPVTPGMDMKLCCDCVGILKERYVDVEQRRGGQCTSNKSRKTTKCRLVFRAIVQTADGSPQILQIASQPISCTQPPGVPEIVRKSVSNCGVTEQPEMFIIGKHFQKDSKVLFQLKEKDSTQTGDEEQVVWSKTVSPDVDVLQATHLVCKVPKFDHTVLPSGHSVEVSVQVLSASKHSEPHALSYHGNGAALDGPSPTKATAVLHSTSLSDLSSGLSLPDKLKILGSVSEDAVRINEEFAATGKFHTRPTSSQLSSKFGSSKQGEKETSTRSLLHEKLDQMTDKQLVELNHIIRSLAAINIDANQETAFQVANEKQPSNEPTAASEEKLPIPLNTSSIMLQKNVTGNLACDTFVVGGGHSASLSSCPPTETRAAFLNDQKVFAGTCNNNKDQVQFSALYNNGSGNTSSLPQPALSSLSCGSKNLSVHYTQMTNVEFDGTNTHGTHAFNSNKHSSSDSDLSSGALLGKHIETAHLYQKAENVGQIVNVTAQDAGFMQQQTERHHRGTYSDVKQEAKFTSNSGINTILGLESSVKVEYAEDKTLEKLSGTLEKNYTSLQAAAADGQMVTSPSGTFKSSASSPELSSRMCVFDSQSTMNSTTAVQKQLPLDNGTFTNTSSPSQVTTGTFTNNNSPTQAASGVFINNNSPTQAASGTFINNSSPTQVASGTFDNNSPTQAASGNFINSNAPTQMASDAFINSNASSLVSTNTFINNNASSLVSTNTFINNDAPSQVSTNSFINNNASSQVSTNSFINSNASTHVVSNSFIDNNSPPQAAAESSTYRVGSSQIPLTANTLQRTYATTPESFKVSNAPTSNFSAALNNTGNNGTGNNNNTKNNNEKSTLDNSKNFTDLQKYLGPNNSDNANLGSCTTSLNDIVMVNPAQPFAANTNPVAASGVMSYANENVASHATSRVASYPTNGSSPQLPPSNDFMNCFSSADGASNSTQVQNENIATSCFISSSTPFTNNISYTSSQQTQNKFQCDSQTSVISQKLSEIGHSLQSVGQQQNLEVKSVSQQNVFGNQPTSNAMTIHHLPNSQLQIQTMANNVHVLAEMNQVPSKMLCVSEPMQLVQGNMSQQHHREAEVQYMPGEQASLLPSNNQQQQTQTNQGVSFQGQHSQENLVLVSQQQSVVSPCEMTRQQNVPQSNCSAQSVPELATMEVQPTQQLHQVLPQIQQSAISSNSLGLSVNSELQPQAAQGQQTVQSYDGLKCSVLVGDGDPLLSQVNTNLSSWTANAYNQSGANSQQKQINASTVNPMQSSYIFMPNDNYQVENNSV